MIFRIIIISILFLNGCGAMSEDNTPFSISVSEIKKPIQRGLLFTLQNTTNKPLKIDRSTLDINEIKFIFYNKDKLLNLERGFPIHDYIQKPITVKAGAFFEKKIVLTSYYPKLNEVLQNHKLKLIWSSQVTIYNDQNKPERIEIKGEVLLTSD